MPGSTRKIVVTEPLDPSAMARLAAAGSVQPMDDTDEASVARAVVDAEALVVRSYTPVTAAVIEAGRHLRVIGRAGAGLEHIDLRAAARRGIVVVHTPAASTQAVAEYTVGLMLALERHIVQGDAAVRCQRFHETRRKLRARELRGLTLGVVGMGRIGKTVAGICHRGLGMGILYNDIVDIPTPDYPAELTTKRRLFREADVISLHVPLTDLTQGFVNEELLSRARPTTTLINTARGGVVDGRALAAALHGGALAGAALDVFDPEPPPADHPLLDAPRTLLSAHLAARTASALSRMCDVVDDVIAVLEGREPKYPAPPPGP